MKPEEERNRTSNYLSYLYLRCSQFEETLEGYNREVESFKKRGMMTTEEMKNNTEKFKELSKNLDDALTEYEVSIY